MLPVKVSWNIDGASEEKSLNIEVLGREPMDVWLPIPESNKETTDEIEAKAWLEGLALSKAFDQLTKQLNAKYGNVVVHNQAYY